MCRFASVHASRKRDIVNYEIQPCENITMAISFRHGWLRCLVKVEVEIDNEKMGLRFSEILVHPGTTTSRPVKLTKYQISDSSYIVNVG